MLKSVLLILFAVLVLAAVIQETYNIGYSAGLRDGYQEGRKEK